MISSCFTGVVATDDLEKAFKNIDSAFLVGALPRKQGMERKDLLSGNVKIFKTQVRSTFMNSIHSQLFVTIIIVIPKAQYLGQRPPSTASIQSGLEQLCENVCY